MSDANKVQKGMPRIFEIISRCETFDEKWKAYSDDKNECEGTVWCSTYHLGKNGSHSVTSIKYAHLGKYVEEIPKEKRKEIMLGIFKEEGYKADKK